MNERNIQPLSDDYIKFIRFGQHFIEKNGSGILAYISNNSFIDGIIHRQMRKHLLESFDKIYILDLHGDAKKKEVCPDGSADQNVFDIMQGVSINIFVKTGFKKKNELGKVFHFDLFGKRENKYGFLFENTLKGIEWNELQPYEPSYFLVKKDFFDSKEYQRGFRIDELFEVNSVGIVTSNDAFLINDTEVDLIKNVETHFKINYNKLLTKKIAYRTFDEKLVYYDVKLIDRARDKVMKHLFQKNLALIVPKQAIKGFKHTFISDVICDKNLIDSAGQFGAGNVFPLYLYPETNAQQTLGQISPPLEGCPKDGVVLSLEGCPTGGVVHSPCGDILAFINNIPIKRNFVENLPYNPALKQRAKDKRRAGIFSEVIFWQQVHKSKFHHIDFDRQRIIGNYIVDFYVKTLGLVVEIDGDSHDDKVEYDAVRQKFLETLGLRVYRISDFDVKCYIGKVMEELEQYIIREYGEETTPASSHPSDGGEFAPIDILDYIYAVLHSPTYREKYKEFLKIDFPRVPYPKDQNTFWQLVKLGGEIRQIHLLESLPKAFGIEKYNTQYPIDGDNMVGKIKYDPAPTLPKGEGAKQVGYITANPLTYKLIKEYREELKDNPTEAEKVIWEYLRNKKTGHKIRRQHVIDDFITDFVCLSKKIVIEVDGKIHGFQKEYDELRTQRLNELGYKVVRFKNEEVFANPIMVVNSIKELLDSKVDLQNEDPSPGSPPLEGLGEVGKVFINDTQYFDNVPKVAWDFYIGGYQPAQKWLKDRKGRNLEFEDILHYQKIIVALAETGRIMKEIDKIDF